MIVWQTNPHDTQRGPCPRCQRHDGKPAGTTWDYEPRGDQDGPPPLHLHCACTLVDVDTPTESFARELLR